LIKELIDEGIITGEFVANYTAAESFQDANGKFPNNLGNVIVVDCSSFGFRIGENIDSIADLLEKSENYTYIAPLVRILADRFREFNFCETAMTIEGVLSKAVNYYTISNNNEMRSQVVKKGRDIMERLSLKSNTSISTPMLDNVK
jgi:hypothetical protein